MSLPPRSLPPQDTIDLWFVEPERVAAPHLERLFGLLAPGELERQARYKFQHLRRDFGITRGLVREVLSAYAPKVAPREWTFEVGEKGKPTPQLPSGTDPFSMNVSHTNGLIGVAIARSEVGMDVETLERRAPLEVADRYFAEEEIRALYAQPEAARARRFFTLWTLKEAWLKAIGTGITHSLSSIVLDVAHSPPIARFPDDTYPGPWQLACFEPTESHLGAVAIRGEAPVKVSLHWPYAAPTSSSRPPS